MSDLDLRVAQHGWEPRPVPGRARPEGRMKPWPWSRQSQSGKLVELAFAAKRVCDAWYADPRSYPTVGEQIDLLWDAISNVQK